MIAGRGATIALAVQLAIVLQPGIASAEPVTTIRSNGPAANRVDIVVLGDGFTAAQVAAGVYRQKVEQLLQSTFMQEPYKEYAGFYNIHLIDVVSNQEGSDHPSRGVFVNTALDSRYDCSGIARLICVDTSKVNAVLSRSAIAVNQRELVVVIVNDQEYGGSGGPVAVVSTDSLAVELLLHETGHTFALLADEYTSQPPECNPSAERVNATAETRRSFIKWAHWIDDSTPIPTTSTTPGVPGLYQGSAYCPTELYRPTYDSKMRSLGRPFEQINTEQHVRRIYNFVSPIDDVSPPQSVTTVRQGDLFSVITPQPATHALDVVWRVDGVVVATGTQFSSAAVSLGSHQIVATVSDATPLVRSDPASLLIDTAVWNVTVEAPLQLNSWPTDLALTSIVGNTVTISWTAPATVSPTGYVLEGGIDPGQTLASMPTGSTATTFTFTAPTGAFYIRVHALVGTSRSVASNEIRIFVNVPAPPSAPANLLGLADGTSLTLAWQNTAAGGAPTEIRLDVTGAVTTSLTMPASESFVFNGVPPGTYTFAVRAMNASGISTASNPVTLTFPGTCSAPSTPAAFSIETNGAHVSIAWGLPANGAAPSGYQLIVGGAFTGTFTTTMRTMTATAPPGTYTLSLVATNACGQSPPTASQTITVP